MDRPKTQACLGKDNDDPSLLILWCYTECLLTLEDSGSGLDLNTDLSAEAIMLTK